MDQIPKNKPLYWVLRYLNLIFTVPNTLAQPYLNNFYVKLVLLKILIFVVCDILPGYHTVSSIRNNVPVDISEDLAIILGISGTTLVSSLFTFQYKEWSLFYINLENCSKFGCRSNIHKLKKKLQLYLNLYSLYVSLGTLTYGVVALLETPRCQKMNELHNLHEICGTFLPLKLPFELRSIFGRVAIFALQFVLVIPSVAAAALICFMTFEATELVVFYIQHLKYLFLLVFDVTSKDEKKKRLRFCIEYHNYMLSLAQQLNRLVKSTTGPMALICAVIFGCLGNQALKSKPLAALIFLVGYMAALFFPCHAGQRLMEQTFSVSEAVYGSKWYEGDAELMKDIRFIIARCQKPVHMGALPLGSFNYPLFLMILKTSYTYLTLLQKTI